MEKILLILTQTTVGLFPLLINYILFYNIWVDFIQNNFKKWVCQLFSLKKII